MNYRLFVRSIVLAILMLSLCGGITHATPTPLSFAQAKELLSAGEQSFDRGLAVAEKEREAANGHFRKAASTWAGLRSSGVHNSKLEFNIANAWMLTGDVGRAIASYRRAAALDPANEIVREGLDSARKRAGVAAPTTSVRTIAQRGIDLARTAQGFASPRIWLWAAGVLWLAGWVALERRFLRATRGMGRLAMSCWILAFLAVGAPVSDALDQRSNVLGVVVAREAVARTGPSDRVYEPAFKEMVRAGLELRIRERRGEWLRVSLPNGQDAWLRADQVEVL